MCSCCIKPLGVQVFGCNSAFPALQCRAKPRTCGSCSMRPGAVNIIQNPRSLSRCKCRHQRSQASRRNTAYRFQISQGLVSKQILLSFRSLFHIPNQTGRPDSCRALGSVRNPRMRIPRCLDRWASGLSIGTLGAQVLKLFSRLVAEALSLSTPALDRDLIGMLSLASPICYR